ncbi:MAG: replication protein [Bacteroidota bacterium]
MENKNLIPNFTQKPNIISDKYCRILSGSAYKILDIICRKTYGFHKTIDKISISQFEEYTGLSNRVVIKSIRELINMGIIIKTGRKKQINSFSINLSSDETSLDKNLTNDVKSQDLMTKRHLSSDETSYTKEILNKRNINNCNSIELPATDPPISKKESLHHYIIERFDKGYKINENPSAINKKKCTEQHIPGDYFFAQSDGDIYGYKFKKNDIVICTDIGVYSTGITMDWEKKELKHVELICSKVKHRCKDFEDQKKFIDNKINWYWRAIRSDHSFWGKLAFLPSKFNSHWNSINEKLMIEIGYKNKEQSNIENLKEQERIKKLVENLK